MPKHEIKKLRLIVNEAGRAPKLCSLPVPVGAAYDDLSAAVQDLILGPEEGRWSKVKEERTENLDPDTGGGTIKVASTFESHNLKLWTHPHDDCCPQFKLEPHDVPPHLDISRLLLTASAEAGTTTSTPANAAAAPSHHGTPTPPLSTEPSTADPEPSGPPLLMQYPLTQLDSSAALRAWWSSLPKGRVNGLRPLAVKRLVAKTAVPPVVRVLERVGAGDKADGEEQEVIEQYRNESVPAVVRHKLMEEGVQGLWELASQRAHAGRLGSKALACLVGTGGLRSNVPHVMEVAAATVWVLSAQADTRKQLVELGAVGALAHASTCAAKWRTDWAAEQERVRLERERAQLEALAALQAVDAPEGEPEPEPAPEPTKPAFKRLLTLTDTKVESRFKGGGIPGLPDNFLAAAEAKLSAQAAVDAAARAAAAALVSPAEGVTPDLEGCNRVVYNCLGALGVLAVDADARAAALQVSPKLQFLVDLATCDFPTPSLPPPHVPTPPPEPVGDGEGAGEEGAAGGGEAEAGVSAEGALAQSEGNSKVEGGGAQPAEGAAVIPDIGAEAGGEENPKEEGGEQGEDVHKQEGELMDAEESIHEMHGVHEVLPQDLAAVHQKMAVDVLYAMLGRDRAVRATLASAGGLHDLLDLTHASNGDVGAAAVLCLAAYARDVGTTQYTYSGQPQSVSKDDQGAWPGCRILADSGDALHMARQLMALVDDLVDMHNNGVSALGRDGDHPLLAVLEAAATAMWGAISAAIVNEEAGGNSMVLARIDSVVEGRPGPQVVSFADASHLARLAGQLVDVLGHVQRQELREANTQLAGPAATGNSHHPTGMPEGDIDAEQSGEGRSVEPSIAGSVVSHKTTKTTKSVRLAPEDVIMDEEDDSDQDVFDHASQWRAESIAPTAMSLSGGPSAMAEAHTGRTPAAYLAGTLYGVMASLAAVQSTPQLLMRAHAALTRMHINLQQLQSDAGEAQCELEAHEVALVAKRTSSRIYHDEDEDLEATARLEANVAAVQAAARELEARIVTMEEDLQSGCEECLAAAQDTLRCISSLLEPDKDKQGAESGLDEGAGSKGQQPGLLQAGRDGVKGLGAEHMSHGQVRRLGCVALAAAAVIDSMATARHPALTPTVADPSPVFNGPFRGLLRKSEVMRDLMDLAQSHAVATSDSGLANATRLVVASAVTHMLAMEDAPPLMDLPVIKAWLFSQMPHPPVLQFTSAALWCLCRHEDTRKGIVADDRWVPLLQRWLSSGLRNLRRHHALVAGMDGFYTLPPNAQERADAEEEARLANQSDSGGSKAASFHGRSYVPTMHSEAPARTLGAQSMGGATGFTAASVAGTDRHAPPQAPSITPTMHTAMTARTSGAGRATALTTARTSSHHQHGDMASVHSDHPIKEEEVEEEPLPYGLLPQEPPLVMQPEYYAHVQGLDAHAVSADLAAAEAGAVIAARQVRFSTMCAWMLLRQWLVDNMSKMNTLTEADGLYMRSATAWWTLQFAMDTPLKLSQAAASGLSLLVETAAALPDLAGSMCSILRELCLRCAWSLSAAHPVVCARLVSLGCAHLAAHTATSMRAGSSLVCVAANYIMHLTPHAEHVAELGGLVQTTAMFVSLVDRALSGASGSGEGVDVEVLEVAVRALARLGLTGEGRAALRATKAIRRLVAVVRADSNALEAVLTAREAAGVPGWENTEELVVPLRAINRLPCTLPKDQQRTANELRAAALKEVAQDAGISSPHTRSTDSPACTHSGRTTPAAPPGSRPLSRSASRRSTGTPLGLREDPGALTDEDKGVREEAETRVSGDAEVGLMALWALLNLSGYPPAQVAICKHGLYTLLRAVHRSADPARSSTATAVLANIHYHPDNATTLYKSELKLKYAALLALQGLPNVERVRLSKLPAGMSPDKPPPGLSAAKIRSSLPRSTISPRTQGVAAPARPASAAVRTSVRVANEQIAASMASLQALNVPPPEGDATKSNVPDPTQPHVQEGGHGPHSGLHPVMTQDGDFQGWEGSEGYYEDPDPEAERAAVEAKVSFLRWVIDPSTAAFDELDALGSPGGPDSLLADALGLSQDELLARLTSDPEEAKWLQFVEAAQKLEGFHQARFVQGAYMRGTFARSLAEGAASLWNARTATKARKEGAGQPATASPPSTNTTTPAGGSSQRSPGSAKSSMSGRPSTAPHARGARSSLGGTGGRFESVLGSKRDHLHRSRKAVPNPVDSPGPNAWRPHVLQFVQEPPGDKARVHLAQRLLVASVPSAVVGGMADLTGKLLENQVLRDGVKALEDKAAAEAAARAQAAQEEAEEVARMEAEARVLDVVRFDSIRPGSTVGSQKRTMSRGVSMAVARSLSRQQSRATSRAVSTAGSVATSTRTTASRVPQGGGLEAARQQRTISMASRRSKVSQGGGVRFSAAQHEGEDGVQRLLLGREEEEEEEEDAGGGGAVDPAAYDDLGSGSSQDLVSDGGSDCSTPRLASARVNASRGSHSFIATSLVQIGALSTLPSGGNNARTPGANTSLQGTPMTPQQQQQQQRMQKGGSFKAGSATKPRVPTLNLGSGAGGIPPRPQTALTRSPGNNYAGPPSMRSVRSSASSLSCGSAHHHHHHHHAPHRDVSRSSLQSAAHPGVAPAGDNGVTGGARVVDEVRWLGADVKAALQRPKTGYIRPHIGRTLPPETKLSTYKSDKQKAMDILLRPERVKKEPEREPDIVPGVPRPVTVLGCGVDRVLGLKEARDALARGGSVFDQEAAARAKAELEASLTGPMPLAVRVATGDGGPDKTWRFPRDMFHDARNMVMFEHVEGASYCDSLYGHYLLPNGKLAHFVLGDMVRKGHKVDLPQPPIQPFTPADWLPAPASGLPLTDVFGRDWGWVGGRGVAAGVTGPLWCPVPVLGPKPSQTVLEWEEGSFGPEGGVLALRSVCMGVSLERVTRVVEEVIEVPAKVKPKKMRKSAAAAGGASPTGRAPAAGLRGSPAGGVGARPVSPAVRGGARR